MVQSRGRSVARNLVKILALGWHALGIALQAIGGSSGVASAANDDPRTTYFPDRARDERKL